MRWRNDRPKLGADMARRDREDAAWSDDPSLGAALPVRNLLEVLGEIHDKHGHIRLREFDERGPRGTWDLDQLIEVVRRDLAAMTASDRARTDVNRYTWGYGTDGMVEVTHLPLRGGWMRQFQQVSGAEMGRRDQMGISEPGYTLDNVEARARENPETFRILPKAEREALRPGDFAKLIFLEGEAGERMWVKVTEVRGRGRYVGVLSNNPFTLESINYGDRVVFSAKNVADITSPHAGMSGERLGIFEAFMAPSEPSPLFEAFRTPLPPSPLWEAMRASPERAARSFKSERQRPGAPERKGGPTAWSPRREAAPPRPKPRIDPATWFNLPDLWSKIRAGRDTEAFRRALAAYEKTEEYADIPLALVAKKGSDQEAITAEFFGVPTQDYERMRAEGTWDRALETMLEDIEKVLNEAVPEEFPGVLEFAFGPDDEFGLYYFEGGD